MKKSMLAWLWIACLSLMLFSGCGNQPYEVSIQETESTAATRVREVESENADVSVDIALCRKALEEIQSNSHIIIDKDQRNRGEDILNDTSKGFFMKSGEDLYCVNSIPQSGILDGIPVWESSFRTLKKGNEYFNDYNDGYLVTTETELQHHFGKSSFTQEENEKCISIPWLLRYQWNESEVKYVSTVSTGEQKSVRLQIEAPFYPDAAGENYTAEFFFKDNTFDRVELVAYYGNTWTTGAGETGVSWADVTITEHVETTDSKIIQAEMDRLYASVLEDIKNTPKE